jgi:glutathione reductase (NADPH)
MVVHGAGRVPNIDTLSLEQANVQVRDGHIETDEYFRSVSNSSVWVAGDANGINPQLTPVARIEAEAVARCITEGTDTSPDFRGIPSVVFTSPCLSRVGLDEQEAREKNFRFRTKNGDMGHWYSVRRSGISHAGYKIIIDTETDEILGAHFIGPHADELVNIFGMAIRNGIRAEQLSHTVWAFPTGASDIVYMV